MLKISPPAAPITLGTSFALAVRTTTDEHGNAIDLATADYQFDCRCGNDKVYTVTPTAHSKVVDGVLHLIFEDYPFAAGTLRVTETYRVTNTLYRDNTQTIVDTTTTNINIIR